MSFRNFTDFKLSAILLFVTRTGRAIFCLFMWNYFMFQQEEGFYSRGHGPEMFHFRIFFSECVFLGCVPEKKGTLMVGTIFLFKITFMFAFT